VTLVVVVVFCFLLAFQKLQIIGHSDVLLENNRWSLYQKGQKRKLHFYS